MHLSNSCWNDVSQDLVGSWNFFEGFVAGTIKLHKVFAIWHRDLREGWDLLEEHVFSFIRGHFAKVSRLLQLGVEVSMIVIWNSLQDTLHIGKKLTSVLSSTSCDAHVSSIFLGFGKSVNAKNQPSASLEVPVVVVEDSRESAVVELLDGSVGLTHFICLFEIL